MPPDSSPRNLQNVAVSEPDSDVTRFLEAGRLRAALKRLKKLGRGANGIDVTRVVLAIANCGDRETIKRCITLVNEVLATAGDNQRLESNERALLRPAVSQLGLNHWAVSRTGCRAVNPGGSFRKTPHAPPPIFVDPDARVYN